MIALSTIDLWCSFTQLESSKFSFSSLIILWSRGLSLGQLPSPKGRPESIYQKNAAETIGQVMSWVVSTAGPLHHWNHQGAKGTLLTNFASCRTIHQGHQTSKAWIAGRQLSQEALEISNIICFASEFKAFGGTRIIPEWNAPAGDGNGSQRSWMPVGRRLRETPATVLGKVARGRWQRRLSFS